MNIRSQMLKSLGICLLSFVIVVLFVLFPHTEKFSLSTYWSNIANFMTELFKHGSLGTSKYHDSANNAVYQAILQSAAVIPTTLVLSFILGILKGILDYWLSKVKLSILGSGTTWLFQSVPDFLLLLLASWVISHTGHKIRFFGDGWTGFYLTVALASIFPIVYVARITYASIASQEGQLYIQTARAKGLPNWMIFFKHIMKNSIGRIFTHFTSLGAYIISSLVLVEYFRNTLGVARRMFIGIDYKSELGMSGTEYEPGVIIGIAFFFMILILLFQLISYGARRYFDPRWERGGEEQ